MSERSFHWRRAMWAATAGVIVYALLLCFAEALLNLLRDPSEMTMAALALFPVAAMFLLAGGTIILVVPLGWGVATLWGFVQGEHSRPCGP